MSFCTIHESQFSDSLDGPKGLKREGTQSLISHPAEGKVKEKLLVEHLSNVGDMTVQRVREMELELTVIGKGELERLAYLIGIFHDFGKATPYFQDYIRNRDRKGDKWTHHSFVSAAVCYIFVEEETGSALWAYAAYEVIKRHHGNLEAFETISDRALKTNIEIAGTQLEKIMSHSSEEVTAFYKQHVKDVNVLKRINFEKIPEAVEDWEYIVKDTLKKDEAKRIEFFFVVNLLFSLLVDSDKKDAARLDLSYFRGNLEEPFSDVMDYIEISRRKDPVKYGDGVPVNRLRNEFLKEIAENEQVSAGNHFYTMTAPTGIGKTFGCLVFAKRMMEKLNRVNSRVIYCLPYTSIIDQNFEEFRKVIENAKGEAYRKRPGRYLLKHHHLASGTIENRVKESEYRYKDYLDDALFVEAWESSFIVTTFVQFFHTIIGYRNGFLKKFHNIVNSIVILDEVQNVDPNYYVLLRDVLDILGKRFGIYFLLVTATQPVIFDQEKSKPVEVVEPGRYMESDVFNRIRLTIRKEPQTLERFKEEFCAEFTDENCLVVLNTKKAAVAMYRHVKENMPGYTVYVLTTNLIPKDRKERIERVKGALKKGEKIIVISTQLVEAGVDFSFKNVYRDFGPMDSIIQVAGRCNRNGEYGELGGRMTLVRLQNEDHRDKEFHTYIYEPIIAQYVDETLTGEQYESREFSMLSEDYFNRFDFRKESKKLLDAICDLNYDRETGEQTPVSQFKLIKEYDEESVYILTAEEAQEDMEALIEKKSMLEEGEMEEEEADRVMLEIERIKSRLREYGLSLRTGDLAEYREKGIVEEVGAYRYISYKNQEEYVYDKEIGFLKEPKKEISGVLCY